MVRGLIAAVVFTLLSLLLAGPGALADPEAVDGVRMAECFAAYDTLVTLGELKKFPEAERAQAAGQRAKAEARALTLYQSEGLNEELARESLAENALFTRSETRELRDGNGIFSIDDVRRMAVECDALVGG